VPVPSLKAGLLSREARLVVYEHLRPRMYQHQGEIHGKSRNIQVTVVGIPHPIVADLQIQDYLSQNKHKKMIKNYVHLRRCHRKYASQIMSMLSMLCCCYNVSLNHLNLKIIHWQCQCLD